MSLVLDQNQSVISSGRLSTVTIDGFPYVVRVLGYSPLTTDPNITYDWRDLLGTVEYLTDNDTTDLPPDQRWIETIPVHRLEVFRPLRSLPSTPLMYHFVSNTRPMGYDVSPSIGKISELGTVGQPLNDVTNHGLGSGIYGLYLPDPALVSMYRSYPEQQVVVISPKNAYFLQDAEHGNTLTVASKELERYIDRFASGIGERGDRAEWPGDRGAEERSDRAEWPNRQAVGERSDRFTSRSTEDLAQQNSDLDRIARLWSFVFIRSFPTTLQGKAPLQTINRSFIASVVERTMTQPFLTDYAGVRSVMAPITVLMLSLGFDAIMADDPENNSWGRGCVYYGAFGVPGVVLESRQSRVRQRSW